MQILFPFVYRVDAVMRRHRTARPVMLLGWDPAEVPEITAAQAPISMRASTASVEFYGNGQRPRIAPLRDEVYRLHQGSLLKAARFGLPVDQGTEETADLESGTLQHEMRAWAASLLARASAQESCTGFRHIFPVSGQRVHSVQAEAAFRSRWIESSERAVTAHKIRWLFERSALVDGALYRPSEGPGWLVLPGQGTARQADGVHRVTTTTTSVLVPELANFNAEQRKMLLPVQDTARVLASIRAQAESNGAEFTVVGGIELLREPGETLASRVVRVVQDLTERMRPDVGFLENSDVQDFVWLRQRLGQVTAASGDAAARTLAKSAARVAGTWARHKEADVTAPESRFVEILSRLAEPPRPEPPPPEAPQGFHEPEDQHAVRLTAEDLTDFALAPRR